MDVGVPEVLLGRLFLNLGAKSSQTFFVDITDVGVNRCDEDIKTEVKFLLFYEQRVVDVRLDNPLSTNLGNVT